MARHIRLQSQLYDDETWNGQPVEDLEPSHVSNVIAYLIRTFDSEEWLESTPLMQRLRELEEECRFEELEMEEGPGFTIEQLARVQPSGWANDFFRADAETKMSMFREASAFLTKRKAQAKERRAKLARNADDLVEAFVLAKYREGHDNHLTACPDVKVSHPDYGVERYGCAAGCEQFTIDAEISCPHDFTDRFEYCEFQDIGDVLQELIEMEFPGADWTWR